METFAELIGETGRLLGIDGLEPDAEGVCIIASEEAEILVIDCTDEADAVLLTATLMPIPPDPRKAAVACLKANHGFRATRGATISLDQDTRNLVLSRYLPFHALGPESLVAAIEEFSSALLSLRPVIGDSATASFPEAREEAQTTEGERETTLDVDGVAVSLRTEDGGDFIVASSELLELPPERLGDVLRDLGIANHLFAETAGATISIDPATNRICMQQRFWAHEGGRDNHDRIALRTAVFADKVREWKERLQNPQPAIPSQPDSFDLLSGFIKV